MSLQTNLKQADIVYNRMVESASKEIIVAYRDSMKEVQSQLADFYRKYGDTKTGEVPLADVYRYNRLKNMEQNISQEISRLGGRQVKLTKDSLTNIYQENYYRHAYALDNAIRQEFNGILQFGIMPKEQIAAAVMNPVDLITQWPESVKDNIAAFQKRIRNNITRGMIQGQSYTQMAQGIKEFYDKEAYRADRVIRTEANRVAQQGTQNSYEQAQAQGVEMMKEWAAGLDKRTRPAHGSADGQRVKVDEPFIVGGEALMHPGDRSGSAGNVINCRCDSIPIVEGYSPQQRRVRLSDKEYQRRLDEAGGDKSKVSRSEVRPYQKYDDWAEDNGIGKYYQGAEPRVSGAMSASDIAGAEKYARDVLGLKTVDYSGMDVELANAVNRRVGEVYAKYPELKTQLTEISTRNLSGNRMAEAGAKHINLNRNTFSSVDRLNMGHGQPFHSTADGLSTITHELGHVMDNYLASKGHYGLPEKFMGRTMAGPFHSSVIRKETLKTTGTRVRDIPNGLSQYATRDAQEFFAEAFAEYVDSPTPRPIASAVGKYLDNLLGR